MRRKQNEPTTTWGAEKQMAELALKVGDSSAYTDGDVLCAFSQRSIRCTHAQDVCFPMAGTHLDLTAEGLWANDSPAEVFEANAKETKIERLTASRARLTSGVFSVEFDSNTPFVDHKGKTVQMDIAQFFSRKLKTLRSAGRAGQPIFGAPGQEVCYGGSTNLTDSALDAIWLAVEAQTPHREATLDLWPAGAQDLKSCLCVSVADFTDDEASALVRPQMLTDANGEQVWEYEGVQQSGVDPPGPEWTAGIAAKRNVVSDWKQPAVLTQLGVTESAVRDRAQNIDARRATTFADRTLLFDRTQNAPIPNGP